MGMFGAKFWGSLLALCVCLASLPQVPSAQELPVLPDPTTDQHVDLFSFVSGGIDISDLSTFSAADVVDSGQSLADVDLLSVSSLASDVSAAPTVQVATALDLLEQQALAFDALQLAEEARLREQRRKEEAEREAEESGIALDRSENPGVPEEWELESFSGCGDPANRNWRARTETVLAFERMCADAAADGVLLVLSSAYRSPARQRQLYLDAIQRYGSSGAARKWVTYSDGVSCSSRHCAGQALDISSRNGAHEWLSKQVGCMTGSGFVPSLDSDCGSGRVVMRGNLYGFVRPMTYEPWHWEFAYYSQSPTAGLASCSPSAALTVAEMVASIFRCRLTEAGYSDSDVTRLVREALTIAKCESNLNASVVVFGGRYVNTPHPQYGTRFSAAGVFQFIRSTANSWVEGGYDNVLDPVANIDAAARLMIHQDRATGDRWQPWECANSSALDGFFATKSVIPGYPNGPASLPRWTLNYV